MSAKRARDPRGHGVAVSSISITRRVERRTLSAEEVGTDQDSDAWFEAYISVDSIDDYTWGVCSLPARAAAGQGKASKDDGALCAYGEVGVQGEAAALPPGVKPCGLSRARRQGIAALRGRNPQNVEDIPDFQPAEWGYLTTSGGSECCYKCVKRIQRDVNCREARPDRTPTFLNLARCTQLYSVALK